MASDFAQWLDTTMSNRGIRGRDLAKKIKVHDSAISRWRNGQGLPSMDACLRLAKALEVDPLRLAVTAGLLDGDGVNVSPLPLPPAHAQRERVREQIRAIKGLTTKEIERLLEAYDAEQKGRRG